jgi:hypothetical protein
MGGNELYARPSKIGPLKVLIDEPVHAFNIKPLLKSLDLIHGNAMQRLEALRVGDA